MAEESKNTGGGGGNIIGAIAGLGQSAFNFFNTKQIMSERKRQNDLFVGIEDIKDVLNRKKDNTHLVLIGVLFIVAIAFFAFYIKNSKN